MQVCLDLILISRLKIPHQKNQKWFQLSKEKLDLATSKDSVDLLTCQEDALLDIIAPRLAKMKLNKQDNKNQSLPRCHIKLFPDLTESAWTCLKLQIKTLKIVKASFLATLKLGTNVSKISLFMISSTTKYQKKIKNKVSSACVASQNQSSSKLKEILGRKSCTANDFYHLI